MIQRIVGLIQSLALLPACSMQSAKRSGYITLQSLRIQQCLERLDDPDCPTKRERYFPVRRNERTSPVTYHWKSTGADPL
jgi:hypothetical protein